jgi:hypothetical protein
MFLARLVQKPRTNRVHRPSGTIRQKNRQYNKLARQTKSPGIMPGRVRLV